MRGGQWVLYDMESTREPLCLLEVVRGIYEHRMIEDVDDCSITRCEGVFLWLKDNCEIM